MKGFVKCIGFVAIVAIIGFTVVACDNGSTNGIDGGGTFTLTDIPPEYEGKYLGVEGWNAYLEMGATEPTLVSGVTVSIPLDILTGSGINKGIPASFTAYFEIGIWNEPTYDSQVKWIAFNNVQFTNGKAAKSFNDADDSGTP